MKQNYAQPQPLTLDDFTYHLPDELIAQQPPPVRHASRLLWVDRTSGQLEDHLFSDLPELLRRGDLLTVNDTRVIPARLLTRRATGGQVELLLLRPQPARPGVWLAMASPLRKLKHGERLLVDDKAGATGTICDFVMDETGQRRVLVDFGGQSDVHQILSRAGLAPLPHYIKRPAGGEPHIQQSADRERYQTIFASAPGAVAAPTAGLHFSPEVLAGLATGGIQLSRITLHVGPGTFKPITTSIEEHTVECERFRISPENATAINQALTEGRRVIAVGTTSCRALETAGASGRLVAAEDASTGLYIKPGFEFKVVRALITNFHLSRSSLLVLVAAFGGYDLIMKAYRHAVEQRYRFYSYGDAMLIT